MGLWEVREQSVVFMAPITHLLTGWLVVARWRCRRCLAEQVRQDAAGPGAGGAQAAAIGAHSAGAASAAAAASSATASSSVL